MRTDTLRRTFVASIALAAVLLGSAREARAVETDGQLWIQLWAQGPIHGPVLGFMEVQPRWFDDMSEIGTVLVRPALGYRLDSWISLWAGYAYTPTLLPRRVEEHRAFQQSILEHELGGLKITNRTRLEQRFIEDRDPVAIRARHMLRFQFPIDEDGRVSAVVWDEVFFNLNDVRPSPRRGFDQNRVFAGLGFRALGGLRIEPGYLFQYVRAVRAEDRANHALLIAVTYRFD